MIQRLLERRADARWDVVGTQRVGGVARGGHGALAGCVCVGAIGEAGGGPGVFSRAWGECVESCMDVDV